MLRHVDPRRLVLTTMRGTGRWLPVALHSPAKVELTLIQLADQSYESSVVIESWKLDLPRCVDRVALFSD